MNLPFRRIRRQRQGTSTRSWQGAPHPGTRLPSIRTWPRACDSALRCLLAALYPRCRRSGFTWNGGTLPGVRYHPVRGSPWRTAAYSGRDADRARSLLGPTAAGLLMHTHCTLNLDHFVSKSATLNCLIGNLRRQRVRRTVICIRHLTGSSSRSSGSPGFLRWWKSLNQVLSKYWSVMA